MTDLTTSLVLSLKNSQFTAGLRSSARQVDQFTNTSSRQIRGLRRDFQSLTGSGLGQLKGELLGLAGGFAAVSAARQSAQLDQELRQIGFTAGVTKEKTSELRKELFDLGKQYGVVVEDSQAAAGSLLASGLEFDQARGATKAIAPASAVTGARPEVLASALSVSSEIFDFDLSRVEVATELLDQMTVAGSAGNAELEDLAGIFSTVGVNAKQAGMELPQALGFIEQLSFIKKQPEQLATLVDSTLRVFTNREYAQKVTDQTGISFYNDDGSRRDPFAVIEDMASIYQTLGTERQRDLYVSDLFGAADQDTQKGIKALLEDGKLDNARAITREILEANGTIAKEMDKALNDAIISAARLKTALREPVDGFIQSINQGFVDITRYLLDTKEEGGLGLGGNELLLGAAGLAAGGYGAYRYGPKALRGVLGKAGGLGAGVATGMALEAATGVQPVYVVNMPSGFGGGPDINISRGSKGKLPGTGGIAGEWIPRGSQGGRLPGKTVPRLPGTGPLGLPAPAAAGVAGAGTLATAATWTGGIAVAGGLGYGAGTLINDYLIDGTEVGDAIGRTVAMVLAGFGNDRAEQALINDSRQQARVRLELPDGMRAREVETSGIDLDVSGSSMVMP